MSFFCSIFRSSFVELCKNEECLDLDLASLTGLGFDFQKIPGFSYDELLWELAQACKNCTEIKLSGWGTLSEVPPLLCPF
jgi:hypothetical protein